MPMKIICNRQEPCVPCGTHGMPIKRSVVCAGAYPHGDDGTSDVPATKKLSPTVHKMQSILCHPERALASVRIQVNKAVGKANTYINLDCHEHATISVNLLSIARSRNDNTLETGI